MAIGVVFKTFVWGWEIARSIVYVLVAALPGTVTRFTTRQPFPLVLKVNTAS
jgi:hypothetical protein